MADHVIPAKQPCERLKIIRGRTDDVLQWNFNWWREVHPEAVIRSVQMDRPGVEYVLYVFYVEEGA